jgi:hypothetical protein
MVPADVRASVTGTLAEYFIPWEVEQWANRRISSRPDRDPYLRKHIGGDLYAVVAEWDLTELERMVMACTDLNRAACLEGRRRPTVVHVGDLVASRKARSMNPASCYRRSWRWHQVI